MELKSKFFSELTTTELYEILRARSEVFVVEQKCLYQDVDGIDFDSLHVFIWIEGRVEAYLRAYVKEPGVVKIGRVLTVTRGKGIGGRLLGDGIRLIKEKFNPEKIVIEAQCHAVGFYEREGFRVCSGEFLDAGIPHVKMEKQM